MGPKAKALAKKDAAEEAAEQRAQLEREKAEAAAWSVGAKDGKKDKLKEDAEAEKQRKAAEKAALLAAEEAELGGIVKAKVPKKKGKDDFDLLSAAIAAQPKTKAQKELEAKKKAADEQKKKEEQARAAKEARVKAQADEVKAAAARGIVMNHTDDLFVPINNRLEEDEISGTGLDGAMDALSMATGGAGGEEKNSNRKALYNAYFEGQLPLLREQNPGLKLSQLKERIFEAWQRAAENPKNQKRAGGATFFDGDGDEGGDDA